MTLLNILGWIFFCALPLILAILIICVILDDVIDSTAPVRDLLRYPKRITPISYATGTLTFKQMLSFYNVRPAAWSFNDGYDAILLKYTTDECETFIFNFTTYGEQYKYKNWQKHREKYLSNLHHAERMSEFISHVRSDARNSAYSAQEEAQKIYNNICNRLNSEEDDE